MSVSSILRRNVIADTTVASLVGSRFYAGELAIVGRPRYPCANFSFQGGTPDADLSEVGSKIIRIWAWSKESYDKTSEIFDAIKAVINNERFADENCYVVFKMITEPMNYFEAIDLIYCTTGNFRARAIER